MLTNTTNPILDSKQLETIIKRVCEWNRIAGNEGKYNQELEDNLFNEEYNEFLEAQRNWDRKEGLDGVVDMIIVYIGSLYKQGITAEAIGNSIHYAMHIGNKRFKHQNTIFNALQDIKPFVSDFYGAFNHILDSNDSKFIKLPNGELKAIKNEAGKIQKGPNYFKPDLSPFITHLNAF